MMASRQVDNNSWFAEYEFDLWAYREGLYNFEELIINNYLTKEGPTLEAGTGGGRLLLELQTRGFTDLHGFDVLPQFVAVAKTRDKSRTIDFRVMDVISLEYADKSFNQVMFLQQVLCFVETDSDRQRAVAEAFRVLRPGGTLVVTLLADRGRREQSRRHRLILAYLACLRKLTFSARTLQSTPWLRVKGNINWAALLDRGPYVYWFREDEAARLFLSAGFEIIAVGTDAQVKNGRFLISFEELSRAPFRGGIYIVCKKPVESK
jgi:SAM-dependent methyltransferase